MSTIINNYDRIIYRATTLYTEQELKMTSQFSSLPITKNTLSKLKTDQRKDEKRAHLANIKKVDMGALDDVLIRMDIRKNLIHYTTNVLTLRNANNQDINAREEERIAHEQANSARLRRQQVTRVLTPDSTSEDLEATTASINMNDELDHKCPDKVYLYRDNKDCACCYCEITPTDISLLDCGHCYHFLCAHRAYKNDPQHRCPLCRAEQMIPPRSTATSTHILGDIMDDIFAP